MTEKKEKKKRSVANRLLKAGPAIGATLGGAYMLKRHGFARGAAETGLAGAITGASLGWLPDIYAEGAQALKTASAYGGSGFFYTHALNQKRARTKAARLKAGLSKEAAAEFWAELEKVSAWWNPLAKGVKTLSEQAAESSVPGALKGAKMRMQAAAGSELKALKGAKTQNLMQSSQAMETDPRIQALRARMAKT